VIVLWSLSNLLNTQGEYHSGNDDDDDDYDDDDHHHHRD